MFRKIAITLNILVALVSSVLFACTFFAEERIAEHARDFVTAKTLAYSRPAIELIEQFTASPVASKLLTAENRLAIEGEVARYHLSPPEYIATLTAENGEPHLRSEPGKIGRFKNRVREYYQSTLRALVRDLRLFTGSNIAAGLSGIFLLSTARMGSSRQLQIFSLAVFASVVISSYMYVDGLSFFRILFKWHMGWSYPVTIGATALYFYRQYQEFEKQNGAR